MRRWRQKNREPRFARLVSVTTRCRFVEVACGESVSLRPDLIRIKGAHKLIHP